MEPGDQVILSYQEYVRYKQYDTENKQLNSTIAALKTEKNNLTNKLQILEDKLVLKNGELCKQQIRTDYLVSLLGQLKKVFNVKGESIGEGFNQMMDDSIRFSVLRVEEKPIDEQLPVDFSKTEEFVKINAQFQVHKTLVQYIAQQWSQKLKSIQYLQKQLKLPAQLKPLPPSSQPLQSLYKKLQQSQHQLQEQLHQARKNLKQTIQRNKQIIESQNNKIQSLQQQNENLKKTLENSRQVIHQSQTKQTKNNQKIKTLQNHVQKLEKEIKQLNNQLKTMKGHQESHYNTDVKTKLISLISEYSIDLKKSYTEMGLTKNQKQQLINNEINEIQQSIQKEIKKIL